MDVLAARGGVDGDQHAAGAGFGHVEDHVADAHLLPGVFGVCVHALDHQVGAEAAHGYGPVQAPVQRLERRQQEEDEKVAEIARKKAEEEKKQKTAETTPEAGTAQTSDR